MTLKQRLEELALLLSQQKGEYSEWSHDLSRRLLRKIAQLYGEKPS